MARLTTVDRHGLLATWENVCLGGHCFLILGGPSTATVVPDMAMLQARGVVTFGVNNVAAAVRTTFWTYGDSTRKFHDAIWRDPGIIKFVPFPKMNNPIRTKLPDGAIVETDLKPVACPSVVGIYRNSDFRPDKYLWEDTINWGVGADSICKALQPWMAEHLALEAVPEMKLAKGQVNWKRVQRELGSGRLPRDVYDKYAPYPKILSTMLQAVRLVYYLGFRNCYLLGADFSMAQDRKYLFDEQGNPGTVRGNNGAYPKLNELFHHLRPVFDQAGFRIFNLNPESQLTAFDYLSFADAHAWATELLPKSIDTVGWYEKD